MQTGQTSQLRLEAIEEVLCKCGCGCYFMAAKTPRMREYVNATHKKRAARKRAKERRGDAVVKLTPEGWLYWQQDNPHLRKSIWEGLNNHQRAVIQFLCDTGMEPGELFQAWYYLFDKS